MAKPHRGSLGDATGGVLYSLLLVTGSVGGKLQILALREATFNAVFLLETKVIGMFGGVCVNTAYAVSSGSNPLAKLHIH